jgi:hypothetical protein
MKQMNCATHRRGSDHLLPLDPDEYRWPPQRFQSQVAKIRLERQNSKIGDHHFTRAHLQFELSEPPDSLPGLLCFWPREKRRCRWPRGQSLAAANNVCGSGDLLPPSPPAEKATARQDQAEQTSTDDGAWNRHRVVWKERALALNSRHFGTAIICCTVLPKMHFSLHDN